MKRLIIFAVIALVHGLSPVENRGGEAVAAPKFSEIYDIVKGALTNQTEADLNKIAVEGFINGLKGQVILGTNNAVSNEPQGQVIGKKDVFEKAYAYIRLGRIQSSAPADLVQTFQNIRATNKLKGLVLDLRFAGGSDYEAAARVADQFLNAEIPLLKRGDKTVRSTTKTNAIPVPVVVLINKETSAAAEALAAMLRTGEVGLLIGSTTAGRASDFQEFSLANGEKLKVARFPIRVGEDVLLTSAGVAPDITVETNIADERMSLEDPFYQPLRIGGKTGNGTNLFNASATARRNWNEAALVRRMREGADPDLPPLKPEEMAPAMTDAALARSLDFLKGLALVQRGRKP